MMHCVDLNNQLSHKTFTNMALKKKVDSLVHGFYTEMGELLGRYKTYTLHTAPEGGRKTG